MKKKLFILFGIAVFVLFLTDSATAQDKHIKVVKGKKLVLKGEVSDQKDRSYFFKAKKGQSITIKVIGRDAVFHSSPNTISMPKLLSKKQNYGRVNDQMQIRANMPFV